MSKATVPALLVLAVAALSGVRVSAQASEQGLAPTAGSQTFADVPPSHPYYTEIEWLYQNGYTAGCAVDPLRYCPDQTMNRAESAVFVERGIQTASYDPPVPTTQVFADLALDSWAAKWVNGLWEDAYTAGCGTDPLMYCPWQGHTRAEGCVFYLRMLYGANYEPPPPSQQTFADVPLQTWYAKWVQAAYDEGLIPGCQSSPEMRFCPDDPLSRGLAAYMMVRAKSGPAPTPTAQPSTATAVPPSSTPTATPTPGGGHTFYVSRTGNNRDGLSWATAWNELSQIQWGVVKPGDTILVDGGATSCNYPVTVTDSFNEPGPAGCGMLYTTTLTIRASGQAGNPITVKLASENGRNGTVRIFGGRSIPLPYCDQTNANWQTTGVNPVGIQTNGQSHIVIDGGKWGGIKVYGNNKYGIELRSASNTIFLANLEVFDNGTYTGSYPDLPGIALSGSQITFDHLLVHDNGQDAFQSGGGVNNVTIQSSWLYNQRPHPDPTRPGEPFNYCRHSDGVQIYGGGTQYGLTVRDAIIGPAFMQGFILGDYAHSGAIATVSDVSIINTLIVGHHGDSGNAGLYTKYQAGTNDSAPMNYRLDHVTVVRDPGALWHSIYIQGTGHTVTNSFFYGGSNITVQGSPVLQNNYYYQIGNSGNIGTSADPRFLDKDYPGIGANFADFDFTITNASIPAGVGSSIRTVADLLGEPPVSAVASASAAAAPIPCFGADNRINADDAKTWAASLLGSVTSRGSANGTGINSPCLSVLHWGGECRR